MKFDLLFQNEEKLNLKVAKEYKQMKNGDIDKVIGK